MRVVGNIYWYSEVGFDCNTYLIIDEMVTLVDPGTNLNKLLKNMEKDGFNIRDINLIVNTHSHPDHCSLNKKVKEISKAKIALHPEEVKHLMVSQEMARYFGLDPLNFKIDFYVEDELKTGKVKWKIFHTPGHSPGSICLYNEEFKILICGDLVFEGSVGRTDFPGGNPIQLKNSIELISKLDVEYLLPGHMNLITGKENVKENFEFIKKTFFNFL